MTTTQLTEIKNLATPRRNLTQANDALGEIGKLIAEQPSAPGKNLTAANPCPACGGSRTAPTALCPKCGRNPAEAKAPPTVMSRAAFDKLPSARRSLYLKSGGQLKD